MSVWEDPKYWEMLARNERRSAQDRRQTVESQRVHLQNAEHYEAQAQKLRETAVTQ